jgi:hypothetical protein
MQNSDVKRFNLEKLNDVEGKEHYLTNELTPWGQSFLKNW